jgi:hypothetical protein
LRHAWTKRIGCIVTHAIQGRRRIHVPECNQGPGTLQIQYRRFEQLIEHADPTRLDHEIRSACAVECAQRVLVALAWIHNDARPLRIRHVTMLLALVRVGLVERDAMAPLVQRAHQAAVIGGRTVPVGRNQAGAEKRNVESVFHDVIKPSSESGCRSSSA